MGNGECDVDSRKKRARTSHVKAFIRVESRGKACVGLGLSIKDERRVVERTGNEGKTYRVS